MTTAVQPPPLLIAAVPFVGEFPFHPFGDQYNYNKSHKAHTVTAIQSITRDVICTSVFGTNYPTFNELQDLGFEYDIVASNDPRLSQKNRTITDTKLFFLKFTRQIYDQQLNNYLALSRTNKKGDLQKVCTLCTNFFTGEFVTHLDKCLTTQELLLQAYVCASCSEESSHSYSHSSHMCSQSHYNNHFRSISLAKNDTLVHLSSLQADLAIVPNFIALIQLVQSKQYYTTKQVSSNWIDHMRRYKVNVEKQTYDLHAHMKVLKETVNEFGEYPLSCYVCESSAARLCGVDYVDFVVQIYERNEKRPQEQQCHCGRRTIIIAKDFAEMYDSVMNNEQKEEDVIPMEQEEIPTAAIRRKNVPVGDFVANYARVMVKSHVFENVADNDTASAESVLKTYMALNKIQLPSALQRTLNVYDVKSMMYNKYQINNNYLVQCHNRFMAESPLYLQYYNNLELEHRRAQALADQQRQQPQGEVDMEQQQHGPELEDPGPPLKVART